LAGNPETTNPMIAPSAISLYDPHTGEHRGKALATRLQVRSRSTYGMDAARQLLAHAYVTKGQTRLDVWDWGPERLLRTMEIGPPLAALDRLLWPPAGALLLGTRSGAGFVVWDTQAGRELWRKERGFLHAAAFFPDGERAVLAYGDPPHHSLPAIWNLRTGQVERQLSVPLQQCWGLALSADGTRLALAGIQAYGPEAVLMDLTTSQVLLRLPDVAGRGLAFSPDGKRLATSHPRNDSVQLWDTETGRLVLVLGGRREEPVQEVIFSLDGRFLAARGGGDGEINLMRIYDAMPLPGEK
jgi:WD40 repeat protein